MKKFALKKINRKKAMKWAILLIVVVLIAYSFIKKSQPASEAVEILTSTAVIGRVESAISGNGTLNPANQYEVKSLVKGEILEAPFEEGDTVKEGQLLYQISTNEIENSMKSAQLTVEKTKLAYQDYLEKKSELQISSRESGYVKKLYVKEGEILSAGKIIADIYNDTIMYIDLLFPSYEVKNSWVGKTALVSMVATGENINGSVTQVSSMEETLAGGVLAKKVTIRIENKGGIQSGDTAEASVGDSVSSTTGTFRAETDTSLISETDGRIQSLSIKEGKWLGKGDTVLSLTSKNLDSQIESAKLSISEAELSLETQKDQMNQYTIEAPISGEVIIKSKKQGDTIDPAYDTQAGPMAIIYDMTHLTFQLNIDELQISSVKVGQKVSIKTEAFPEDSYEGVIEKICLKGITNNGVTSYPVTVKVTQYGNLLPGMNVTGKIILEEADHVLMIPSAALQRDNMVYIKSEETGKKETENKKAENVDLSDIPSGFTSIPVTIGINDGSNVEIIDGLKEGDIVYVPFDASAEQPEEEGM